MKQILLSQASSVSPRRNRNRKARAREQRHLDGIKESCYVIASSLSRKESQQSTPLKPMRRSPSSRLDRHLLVGTGAQSSPRRVKVKPKIVRLYPMINRQ